MRPDPILDARLHDTAAGAPTFTLGNRLWRVAWTISWTLLARWTPAPLHRWRAMVVALFGGDVDPSVHIYPSAKIWDPRNLCMQQFSALGRNVNCYSMAKITLGRRVVVSQGAHLCAGTHDVDDPHFQLLARPIFIYDHAWVAAEAFVGPGVTIGEGAVLGARGVTVKDLPAWTIWAGNPARLIRSRKAST
jgi:putative colanic acid biosynthesis acetyltransferase WcaF